MEVYWLAQNAADVPGDESWLSAGESSRLHALRIPKRRSDWRLGRWTAKHAVAAYLNLPADMPSLAQIEISASASGAPEVLINQRTASCAISISHRDGVAICAISAADVAVGCDLEKIEPRSEAFIADYLTAREQALIANGASADRRTLAALIWSAKESVLKLLRVGLRADTRSVEISLDRHVPDGWRALQACTDGRNFQGWWQCSGDFVRTVVADPPASVPVAIMLPPRLHSTTSQATVPQITSSARLIL